MARDAEERETNDLARARTYGHADEKEIQTRSKRKVSESERRDAEKEEDRLPRVLVDKRSQLNEERHKQN